MKLSQEILDQIEKVLTQLSANGIDKNIIELEKIVQVSFELMNSVHDSKTKLKFHHEKMQEQLVYKLGFNTFSIIHLARGQEIKLMRKSDQTKIIDFPSIYILSRAALECYLTIEYIYYNDLSEEEKFFRYKLWEVSGLITRQDLDPGENEEFKKRRGKTFNRDIKRRNIC